LVIGLEGATRELLLEDERLVTLRHLMGMGAWGELESVIPPASIPAWLCLATGQDPGSLGIYGWRDRLGRAYREAGGRRPRPPRPAAVWDPPLQQGGTAVLVGVPPFCRPRATVGHGAHTVVSLGATRGTSGPEARQRPAGAADPGLDRTAATRPAGDDRIQDALTAAGHRRLETASQQLRQADWRYLQVVDPTLGRLQRAGEPSGGYVAQLDEAIGRLLAEVGDDTVVLVVSPYGRGRPEGRLALNDWLVAEGLLRLRRTTRAPGPLESADVDWPATRAWAAGGVCGGIYLNVAGREPAGQIGRGEVASWREEIGARLAAATDADGRPLDLVAERPEALFRAVRGPAPDVIVRFRGLAGRFLAGVGHGRALDRPARAAAGDVAAARGCFILAAPHRRPAGALTGVHLLDVAPTLLELAGWAVPPSMPGHSLAGKLADGGPGGALSEDDEAQIRARLAGLGYIG
jgi:predicted AlkP superfamily phosphohydrolase/phosphomutase